jgi:hypothetical protein
MPQRELQRRGGGLLQRVADHEKRPAWNETSFFKRFAK